MKNGDPTQKVGKIQEEKTKHKVKI